MQSGFLENSVKKIKEALSFDSGAKMAKEVHRQNLAKRNSPKPYDGPDTIETQILQDLTFDPKCLAGVGAFATVSSSKQNIDGELRDVAIKVAQEEAILPTMTQEEKGKAEYINKLLPTIFINECRMVELIRDAKKRDKSDCHQYVITYFTFSLQSRTITMEYIEGLSLRLILKELDKSKRTNQPPPTYFQNIVEIKPRAVFMKQAIGAIWYLHRNGIIHNDVRSENLFVGFDDSSGQFYAKLGDFGISDRIGEKPLAIGGTPVWTAPEKLIDATKASTKSDIYSYGITLFEIASLNTEPDNGFADGKALAAARINGLRPEYANLNFPENMVTDMVAAWDNDPNKRPDAEELYNRSKTYHL